MTPASGIVADREIMTTLKVGDHGSTYGGNPLSMAIVKAAVGVLKDEGMVENSAEVGPYMKRKLEAMTNKSLVREIRGRGLMNALEIEKNSSVNGNDFCDILRENNLLTKATKDYICRLTPALNITKQEVDETVAIVDECLGKLERLNEERTGSKLYEK
jgi:ornithine--oxo-acid transaminase